MRYFVKKLNHMASHEEKRLRVCILCITKLKVYIKISDNLKNKLECLTGFNLNNIKFPTVICQKCETMIYKNRNVTLPDYSKFKDIEPTRLILDKCDCYLCEIARKNNKFNLNKKNKKLKNKVFQKISGI